MKTLFYKRPESSTRLDISVLAAKALPIIFTFSILFFTTTIFAQLAPVNPPAGGFAIDGGLKANTPTSPTSAQPFLAPNQGDWYPGPGGTGGAVFNASGLPVNAATSGRAVPDPYNGNDNIFTNGSKFNDYIGDLHWFTNSAPDKNDINNALYHVSRDGSNNQWAFIAGDRLSTSGTSYIDFEFLQGTVTETANGFVGTPAAGKPSGGGRTQNDLVISMEYTNGGTKPNVFIYQWKLSGSTWSYQLTSIANLAANAFAETNRTGAETGLPYSAFGNTSYQQFAFVEAAVNVTYLINQTSGGDACSGLSIKTLWIKTKASASSTAALKDFVDPIPVNFQFGQAGIDPLGPFCADNTTAQTLTATPAGGTFKVDGVASNGQFTPSVAGVGDHIITYSFSGCTATSTITVNPSPTIGGTPTACVGSTTQLTGTGTPAALSPWVSSNTSVATVSSTGLVTGVSSGTSTITFTNSSGCQATTLVTINALPLAPQLNVVPPTCSNSNGTVTVTSPTGADFVYSNNDGAFQASTSFTVASNAAYSIKVKRVSTGCISTATSGTMGSAQGTPAADVVIQSSPSCTSLTGTLKVVQAAGGDYDNTIYEFSSDGTNFGSNPVFTFTAGQGYSITVRRISDHTCTATTSCTGQAAAKTVSSGPGQAKSIITNAPVTYISPEQARVTAYPNPFSNMVRFAIESPVAGKATLDVYNTTGQKLQTIYQGYLFAGKQQLINYRPSTTNGTLIYTLKVGNQQVNGKLIQLKQ